MEKQKKKKRKMKLIYSMSSMIIFCWLVPLLLFTYLLLFLITGSMSDQIENTILTSADKAVEICVMQIDDVVAASRNASYITTVKDSYVEYLKNGRAQDLYNNVTLFLAQQYKYNKNVQNAMLFFLDYPDEIYYTYGSSNASAYPGIQEFLDECQPPIMEIVKEGDTGVKFLRIGERLFLVRNMVDSSFHPYAVIVLELNTESVFESLNSVWSATGFQIYLEGEEIVTMGDFTKDAFMEFPEAFEKAQGKSVYVHKDDAAYVCKAVKSEGFSIGFLVQLDSQAILDELGITKVVLIILLVFMIPLILIIFLTLYRKVNRPISRLVEEAQAIRQGDYGRQLEDDSNSLEFDSLVNSFNAMSMELKHQFEKIYLEELELKDAQIMALQSQINPHFLNNTLEIINWESRLSGNTKASSMIEALSVMLNATMNRKKQNMISLSEELSYVDAYLLIIQQRFGSRLRVTKHIDQSILGVEVPRLIIQPIIENAVEHGMDAKNQGRVTLDIYAADDKIYIDVTNIGTMSEEDCRKVEYLLGSEGREEEMKSTSLGIRNVNRRIKIIYGEECGLTIKNSEDGYTVSRIVLDRKRDRGEAYEETTHDI